MAGFGISKNLSNMTKHAHEAERKNGSHEIEKEEVGRTDS